ncbi:MAG: SurA N-terminal domain-containing protein [Victivallaceae bacterium]|nr:SurA N-terminal domain-containing protein [Victivallaceae bacterium]
MVIRRMNSIFSKHSRWLFSIFTIIIIVSFLGFLTPGGFGGFSFGGGDAAVAYDKKISMDDLHDYSEKLGLVNLISGNRGSVNVEEAFSFASMLEAARRAGVTAGEKEALVMIQNLPRFQEKGKFSVENYRKFLEQLGHSGYSENDLIEVVRLIATVQKFYAQIGEGVVLTPQELKLFSRSLHAPRTVVAAEFKGADYGKQAKLTDDAVRQYFQANREKYKVPAKFNAVLACFRLDDPKVKTEAEKLATPAALRKYYDQNQDLYKGKDGKVLAYDAVAKKVRADFVDFTIRELNFRAARLFARDAYDAVGEAEKSPLKGFLAICAARRVQVIQCGAVSADSSKIGGIESAVLVKDMAESGNSVPVSNAVKVGSAAYVGFAGSFQPERQAELNECKNKVMREALQAAQVSLARESASKVAASMAAIPAAQRSAKLPKSFTLSRTFTLADRNQPSNVAESMMRQAAATLAVNEFSPVIATPDGALIVYFAKIGSPDGKAVEKGAALDEYMLRREKGNSLQRDFEQRHNQSCKLQLAR